MRRVAFGLLIDYWIDDTTYALLFQQVPIDGVAAVQLREAHSQFGGGVFSYNLNGNAPYLDPRQPIARDHIEQAAKHSNLPPARIDEIVQSLSEHMGWDITKGSVEKDQQ